MSTGAPRRPSLPPVLWLAVAMCVGCVAGEHVTWARWAETSVAGWLAGVGLGSAAVVMAAVRAPRLRTIAVLAVAGLLAGTCVSAVQGAQWLAQSATVADCGAREWTGVVEADPTPGTYGTIVRVRITGGPLHGARVRVSWPDGCEAPDLGRTVRFAAVLEALPADEAWARTVAHSGVCATGRAWRAEVGAWRPGVAGALFAWRAGRLDAVSGIEGAGGDLLEGVVLGDRRRLVGTATDEDFRILGLTHLVAVSGSHLALACAAVAALGTLARVPRRPLIIATLIAGGVYALVTGMAYSALRSLLMLAVGSGGQLLGRKGSGVASLGVAVIAVLATQPWSVYDLGLQLSALAVAGLLIFGSLAMEWASFGMSRVGATASNVFALTCVAQVLTMPVIASAFGVMSVFAPVANAVAGPLVEVALAIGLAGVVVGSVFSEVGVILANVAAAILGATAWLASGMAELPGAAVSMGGGVLSVVGVMGASAAVWAVWPLPKTTRASRRALGAVVILSAALAIGPAPARETSLVVLDVGQGDAILVRDAGRTMLVDTGADGDVLRAALHRHGVRRIDVLVLTHAHDDHTGGVDGLSGTQTVGWVGVSGAASADGTWDARPWPSVGGAPVRALKIGDTWWIGDIGVEVVWPAPDVTGMSTNDTSVVLNLRCGGFDAVLTGDVEGAAQAGMLERGGGREVEVLKVPHHGSTNGLTAEALAVWAPRDAIVSVGTGNDFGHPHAEALALLEEANVRVWRTDKAGDVTVSINRDGYRISAAASGPERQDPAATSGLQEGQPLAWRGGWTAVHARMQGVAACDARYAAVWPLDPEVNDGRSGHRRTEACLPDLRGGGAAARPRGPPPEGPGGRGGRPRFQLRCLLG